MIIVTRHFDHVSTMIEFMEEEGPCGDCIRNTDPEVDGGCTLLAMAVLEEPMEEWEAHEVDALDGGESGWTITCTEQRPA